MVANALSLKADSAIDREHYLRKAIDFALDLFREAQAKGVNRENWKNKGIRGEIDRFSIDSRILLTLFGRVSVPFLGKVQQILLEEAHNSMFSIHVGAKKTY